MRLKIEKDGIIRGGYVDYRFEYLVDSVKIYYTAEVLVKVFISTKPYRTQGVYEVSPAAVQHSSYDEPTDAPQIFGNMTAHVISPYVVAVQVHDKNISGLIWLSGQGAVIDIMRGEFQVSAAGLRASVTLVRG